MASTRLALTPSQKDTQGCAVIPQAARPPAAHQPVWELFADAFTAVPEDELARLPVDGAAQHDHYIYGLSKRLGRSIL